MLCFPTQIKVGTQYVKDQQVLRLEHRLGPMEILKNLKRNILKFIYFFFVEKIYILGHLIRELRALANLAKLMAREYEWGYSNLPLLLGFIQHPGISK